MPRYESYLFELLNLEWLSFYSFAHRSIALFLHLAIEQVGVMGRVMRMELSPTSENPLPNQCTNVMEKRKSIVFFLLACMYVSY